MSELPICGWCHQPYGTDFNAHRRNECPDMRDLSRIRPALLERVRAEARATALAEREALVAPVRALRFSAAAVHDALAYLGPTGTGAEAVVKTAALATAAILDALAKTPTKLAPSASPVKREALREAAIQYLASDGSHGLYDAGWMVRARHSLVALVGGVEPIEAAQDRMMTVYGEPIVPPAAALAEREAPVA